MRKHVVKSLASRWFIVETFLAHYSQKWRNMIDVKQEDDGSLTITWNENDPKENILGTWTQEDFIHAIEDKLNSLKELGVLDNATEAINQVTEYFIDQTPEEVNQDINTLHDWYKVKEDAIREYQSDQLAEERTLPPPNFPIFP